MENSEIDRILLIGFMGTQKSSAGKLLAEKLAYRFVDMDEMIVSNQGMEISRIFAEKGEAYFRSVETETAKALHKEQKIVISTGGGIPMREENMQYLDGFAVLLTCGAEELYRRIGKDKSRPVASELELQEMADLYEKRKPYYMKYAELIVDTTENSPEKTAEEIYAALRKKMKQQKRIDRYYALLPGDLRQIGGKSK